MNHIDVFDMDNSKIYSIGNLAWKPQNSQMRGNTLNEVHGINPKTLTMFFYNLVKDSIKLHFR